MEDHDKSKEELIAELVALRQQITEIKALASQGLSLPEVVEKLEGITSEIDARNITEQEQTWQQATQHYRQLFEEAPVMYIFTRHDGATPIVIDCNELLLKTLGYRREEVLQHPVHKFYTPDSQAKLKVGGYLRALRGEFISEERELVTSDGRVIETLLRASPETDANGQVIGSRVMYIDISGRKNLEMQLQAIYELGHGLALLRDEASILRRVMETATSTLRFDFATYGLVDEAAHTLQIRNESLEKIDVSLPLDGEQGITVFVVCTGQALNVPDTRQNPRYLPMREGVSSLSELCVPLKVGDRVIGVLNVESIEPNRFTPADQQLLQTLADQAAVALENARLHTETQQRAKELAMLNKASQAITASLELNAVLEQVMTEVKTTLEVEGASALLLEPSGDKLIFVAAASSGVEKMIGTTVPLTDSIAGWVIYRREPVLIRDAQLDPRFYARIDSLTGLTTHSLLAVPLFIESEAIGVIEVINHTAGAFGLHDLEILEALASSAAIAIENARLHAEIKRRVQQLVVLHELDWVITASLQIKDVYYALAGHTARLFPFDYMSIALLQEDGVHLAYVAGQEELTPAEEVILPRPDSVTHWVTEQGHPLLRRNIAGDMRFSEDQQLVAMGIQSEMVIPLRVKGQVFGSWNIGNRQTGFYSRDDLAIAGSIGDQLAIAIENARLYEAEQEQYRRLQQSQAQLIQVEKMAALGRLVASIAHEINNPIQAIQHALTLVEEELADPRPGKIELYMSIAQSEFERIAAIVRRMRDFYRRPALRSYTYSPDPASLDNFYLLSPSELRPLDLHKILDNVLQLANKQLQNGGIKVELTWAGNLPKIQGSTDQLQQVFLNLTLNAFDAMAPQGGGTLRIQTLPDQQELPGGQFKPVARIEFSDTGAGIAPEVLSRIFEPLFTTKEQGSGFGLFTSYKIIEAHRGQITAESQVGVGTKFTILLPTE
ncbi:MAG: GAF domain-containing protein [Chloroflexi bacterium]|nr:GAF domain-containing protein [Chloroflexota bacterium]